MIQNTDNIIQTFKPKSLKVRPLEYQSTQPYDWIKNHKLYTIENILEIGITAKNTELWITKQQKNCVVVLGESWSYGDRLHDVDGGLEVESLHGKDHLSFRLNNIFAGHCANLLQSDLYICSIPGCNNTELVFHLPNILNFLKDKYQNIKVIFQITSPGRCFSSPKWSKNYNKNYMSVSLGVNASPENTVQLFEYMKSYEKSIIELVKGFCQSYDAECLIWRNFNSVLNLDAHNVLPVSWIEYLCNLHQIDIDLPVCNEIEWWNKWAKIIPILKISTDEINQQLDKVKSCYNFLQSTPFCKWHPQITAHWLWAQKILNHSNWNAV